ncbi:virginiamycin A acetyltransferase [Evansella caseinilytica]|uniref:Virginiamycin A acetyltransferase n=1 Tax=Evansella caseinilytica TaxID=1503961 RepID=A0A1H3I755_9BACI|nr:Vat family streptogramin A O-acetyltransferase [Evansella caseinilytica]SDY23472.1 virginiamycin A acetyltransferase [Evansella caseinilytica]
MYGPNPRDAFPIEGNRSVQFINNTLTKPNIKVGDYSYYDAEGGETFEDQVLYHYEALGDQLIIGKFCSIGPNTTFIMNGANHRMDGSTYPFNLFGQGWERHTPTLDQLPLKGSTVVGNDVWIGKDVTIMPGVTIGDGAIIAAKSVIAKDVGPYTIVAGNPGRAIRKRFSEETIEALLRIKWWDLDIRVITEHLDAILSTQLDVLNRLRRE